MRRLPADARVEPASPTGNRRAKRRWKGDKSVASQYLDLRAESSPADDLAIRIAGSQLRSLGGHGKWG